MAQTAHDSWIESRLDADGFSPDCGKVDCKCDLEAIEAEEVTRLLIREMGAVQSQYGAI